MPAASVQYGATKTAATPGDAPVIRDDIGPEIVSEINFLRTKPKQYAEMLRKDRMPYFRRTCGRIGELKRDHTLTQHGKNSPP